MKTPIRFGLLAGSALLPLPAWPDEPAPADGPDAKPYVLFMRTDVSIEQDRKLYPVRDVSGRAFVVTMDGQPKEVPMAGLPHRIEFQNTLVLARATAKLTGLTSERTYAPGTDPRMVRQREAVLVNSVMGDNSSLAEGQFIRAKNGGFSISGGAGGQGGGTVGGPGGEGRIAASMGAAATQGASAGRAEQQLPWDDPDHPGKETKATIAFGSMVQANSMMASDLGQAASGRLRAEADLAKELFDAIEVRFEFSSEVYLEKPYLVVVSRFHEPGAKLSESRRGVFAKALEPMGSHPTKIDVIHGGFPPGFELEDVQVHLYNEGREIPTEVAQKRVPLSREDAFEYLKIDYFRGNKGKTLPPTAALGRPTKEERLRLAPNQWKAVYYAKVSKEGQPLGTFMDEACSQPVDDTIAALAQNVRYYPALDQGKQVEGIARLSWSKLAL